MRFDMEIRVEQPEELGADRIVNAVAAWEQIHAPLIVIDFGTAITFDCVGAGPAYLGGTIHPGIGISLDALASRTAKLPRLDINAILRAFLLRTGRPRVVVAEVDPNTCTIWSDR